MKKETKKEYYYPTRYERFINFLVRKVPFIRDFFSSSTWGGYGL